MVAGIPVIESGSNGTRFGRIDLVYDRSARASDFVATGGDALFTGIVDPAAIQILEDGPNLRDAIAEVLTKGGGTLRPDDPKLFSTDHPRWTYPGTRPVSCAP